MSNSSKMHGSSSGDKIKGDLVSLRKAWKRGKAISPEAEKRIINALPDDKDWGIALELLRSKALDAATHEAQLQKKYMLSDFAERFLSSFAFKLEACTIDYFSLETKEPKKLRKNIAYDAKYLAQFIDALPVSENKIQLQETCDVAALLTKCTKTPPSPDFVLGWGAKKRIHTLLNGAGAGEKSAVWAAEYLSASLGLIPNKDKKASTIANVLLLSAQHTTSQSSKTIHPNTSQAVLWATSNLVKSEAPIFSKLVQSKLRKIANKEPRGSPARNLPGIFENALKGIYYQTETEEEGRLGPLNLLRRLGEGEVIVQSEQEEIALFYKHQPIPKKINAALLLSNAQISNKKTANNCHEIICSILADVGEGTITAKKEGQTVIDPPQTAERMKQKILEVMNKKEVKNEIIIYAFGTAEQEEIKIADRLIDQYTPAEISKALEGIVQNSTDEDYAEEAVSAGTMYLIGSGQATREDLLSIYNALANQGRDPELRKAMEPVLDSAEDEDFRAEIDALGTTPPVDEAEEAESIDAPGTEPQTITSFPEILHALIQGKDIQSARFEYTNQPKYVLLDMALALSKVEIPPEKDALNMQRAQLISSLLAPLRDTSPDAVLLPSDPRWNLVVGVSREELEETIMKILRHPEIKEEVTNFAFEQLTENREMNDLEKIQMVDKLFSWYDNQHTVTLLSGVTSSLIVDSTKENYPQEVIRHLISKLLEKNENEEWVPQILGFVDRIERLDLDPDFVAIVEKATRTEEEVQATTEPDEEHLAFDEPEGPFEDSDPLQEPETDEPAEIKLPEAEPLPEPQNQLPEELPEEQPEEETEEEPKEAEESIIFSKLDEAEPLLRIIASSDSKEDAADAYTDLASLLAESGFICSLEEMILELHDLAINTDDAELSGLATKALISLPYLSQRIEVSPSTFNWIVSNVLEVPAEITNPILMDALSNGAAEEIECALNVLAERAKEKTGAMDSRGRVRPIYALAAEEIVETFHIDEASNLLFSLSKDDAVPIKHLLAPLEDLHKISPKQIEGLVLDVLLGCRSTQENNLFKATVEYTDDEAALAEEFLFNLGGALKSGNESVAEAVLQLSGTRAAKFAIQTFNETSTNTSLWARVLIGLKGPQVDQLLIQNLDLLDARVTAEAINVLAAREPSMEKAEFFLGLVGREEGKVALAAANALAEMDFSSFEEPEEFGLLYIMRQHPQDILESAAAERLELFLMENETVFSSEYAVHMSNLAEGDPSEKVRELALRNLLHSSGHLLGAEHSIEPGKWAAALEELPEAATLATYAIANKVKSGDASPQFIDSLDAALLQFEEHWDTIAHLRLMRAARISENFAFANKVLVHSLASRNEISTEASKHLLNMGSLGIEIAALAAKEENLPEYMIKEMQKRISNNAIDILCTANAVDELVPMLGHTDTEMRSTIHDFLADSTFTEKKADALFAGLDSEDEDVRCGCLTLLPREREYLPKILALAEDSSLIVSTKAANISASILSTQDFASFLLDEKPSDPAKQEVADAALSTSPKIVEEMAKHLAGNPGLPNALKYFQIENTLNHLYSFWQNAEEGNAEGLGGPLAYFCNRLAGFSPGLEQTNEQMLILLETSILFDHEEVQAIAKKSAAEGPTASLMLTGAIESLDAEVLYKASTLFLEVADGARAVQAALQFRKLADRSLSGPCEAVHEQVIFEEKYDRVRDIVPLANAPLADPWPYVFVQEMALSEFVDSRGSKFELLAEFLEERMIKETQFDSAISGSLGKPAAEGVRAILHSILLMRGGECPDLAMPEEGVTPAQARSDARKLGASRPKAEPPNRPAGTNPKPKKIPRGGGSGPDN